jgi:hypothetical protein
MQSAHQITASLEEYLSRLDQVQQRWQKWLLETQRAAMKLNAEQLQQLHADAEELHAELLSVCDRRSQILADARQSGWAANTLRSLAEQLPAWSRPRFRFSFSVALNQSAQLKRYHQATWVLLNRTANHFSDLMRIMTLGTTRQDTYFVEQAPFAERGGQLLNANL